MNLKKSNSLPPLMYDKDLIKEMQRFNRSLGIFPQNTGSPQISSSPQTPSIPQIPSGPPPPQTTVNIFTQLEVFWNFELFIVLSLALILIYLLFLLYKRKQVKDDSSEFSSINSKITKFYFIFCTILSLFSLLFLASGLSLYSNRPKYFSNQPGLLDEFKKINPDEIVDLTTKLPENFIQFFKSFSNPIFFISHATAVVLLFFFLAWTYFILNEKDDSFLKKKSKKLIYTIVGSAISVLVCMLVFIAFKSGLAFV